MHHSRAQSDSTTDLPPVQLTVTKNEPGSGGYRRDRERFFNWLVGGFAALVVLAGYAIVRHEMMLNSIGVKMDLLMEHFGLEIKK